jgi:hypothetical protein
MSRGRGGSALAKGSVSGSERHDGTSTFMSHSEKAAKIIQALQAAEGMPAQQALRILNKLTMLMQGDLEQSFEIEEARANTFLAICEIAKGSASRPARRSPVAAGNRCSRTMDVRCGTR